MSSKKSKFEKPNIEGAQIELKKMLKALPQQIGAMSERFFKESFENQGFTDQTLQPWQKTKTKSNTFGAQSEGILINSGTLKRSLTYAASKNRVETFVDGDVVPYAKIHNEGGMVTFAITQRSRKFFWYMYSKTNDSMWKALALTKKTSISFKMPKRQFIGHSATLNNQIDKHIVSSFKKVENVLNRRI